MNGFIRKTGELLDFTFGTLPISSAGYGTERLRQMRFTGVPVRALDRACQWASKHWDEGTIEARKSVAVSKVATYVDMLRTVDLPITEKNLTDAIMTIGLNQEQAEACVQTIQDRELAMVVPEYEETVEEEAERLVGATDA